MGYEPDTTEHRNNSDPSTNSYCQKLLDLVTDCRLKILNGRTLGDCEGKLTCYKHNGCSTVDYFITSPILRSLINSLQVLDLNSYSDHCPLVLDLYLTKPFELFMPLFNFEKMPPMYKCNEEGVSKFIDFQETEEADSMFVNITNKTFTLDKHGSEIFTNEFTKIIQLMASSSLTVKRTVSNLPHKKWFDSECKNSKQNLNRLARNCSSHPFCTEIRSIYHSERNKHSRLMKQRRSKFLSRLNESIQ